MYVKATTQIGEGKLFAPGNLRCTLDNPEYERLVSHYVREQYTLRYTGGMVPDVYQIIVKEKGVFTNVMASHLRCNGSPSAFFSECNGILGNNLFRHMHFNWIFRIFVCVFFSSSVSCLFPVYLMFPVDETIDCIPFYLT